MKTLVLGIGNLLWADEGFGVRCVERFHERYQVNPDEVELMDGGTQGIYLVNHVESCESLLVFDAIDYGLEAGTIKVVEGDAVPRFMGVKKMSLHQTGFQEVISTAQLMGWEPKHLTMIGVQPECIEDYGGSLTDTMKALLDTCVDMGAETLRSWGVACVLRDTQDKAIIPSELDINTYEANRPSEVEACRVGDDRILTSSDYDISPLDHDIECCRSVPIDGRLLFANKE